MGTSYNCARLWNSKLSLLAGSLGMVTLFSLSLLVALLVIWPKICLVSPASISSTEEAEGSKEARAKEAEAEALLLVSVVMVPFGTATKFSAAVAEAAPA